MGVSLRKLFTPSSALLLACLSGCGGSGGVSGGGPIGTEQAKPGGGTFFLDPHQGGNASRLRIEEMVWGRLVDVHDIDADGVPGVEPIFRDMVVQENRISDGDNYLLDKNPATQETRLVILRTRGAPDDGTGTFESLLAAATASLPPILPKADDGTAPGPFSVIPRNATVMVRFDDVLDDGALAESRLTDTVHLLAGYPPVVPQTARLLFDPNHGAVVGGAFHSTRLLIDLTVSEAEASGMSTPLPINAVGLPASQPNTSGPNVSLRIPTRIDYGAGQFYLFHGLSGSPLATTNAGPVDPSTATQDVVRAMRSGNGEDLNNGFLLDPVPPRLLGSWGLVVLDAAEDVGAGPPGTRFRIDVRFDTPCRRAPAPGDIVLVGQRFLEVVTAAVAPQASGFVPDVAVRLISGDPLTTTNVLLGGAEFLTAFEPGPGVPPACWVNLVPQALDPPDQDVSTHVQLIARFSEAMDPDSVRPFDSFRVIRGVAGTSPLPRNIVIGSIENSLDLTEFTFVPLLPLTTENGPNYVVELASGARGVTDLAGNGLRDAIPIAEFLLDPGEAQQRNGGVALRFSSLDELDPIGAFDFRGQGFLDTSREVLQPRAVSFTSLPVDRSVPVVSLMTPFPPGLQTPLTPLGSKLQAVWRYVDVGWQVRDESKYNMDVVGMSWSPIGGQVIADFYPQFEMRLATCRKLPDEEFQGAGPSYPGSGIGLSGGGGCVSPTPGLPYADNILPDPNSPQKVVHPRSFGYRIDPADLYANPGGTFLMPFPMNRHVSTPVTYTWRDTAVQAKDGIGGAGVPMDIEVGPPLFIESGVGSLAGPGQVPSIGLPLLWEIRCYPSSSGLGLNSLDVSIVINTFCEPSFRCFSTGGIDTSGSAVIKDPDLEIFPSGGFNPSSSPPGRPTPLNTDGIFYIGQLDLAIKVSRAHTIWIDSALSNPRYLPAIQEPRSSEQPAGTRVVVDYRGADSFAPGSGQAPFDALSLDAYGDLPPGSVNFFNGSKAWTSDVSDLDGARYVQLRLSFFNNLDSGQRAELDSLGFAWEQ